jgi:hypothetical protein
MPSGGKCWTTHPRTSWDPAVRVLCACRAIPEVPLSRARCDLWCLTSGVVLWTCLRRRHPSILSVTERGRARPRHRLPARARRVPDGGAGPLERWAELAAARPAASGSQRGVAADRLMGKGRAAARPRGRDRSATLEARAVSASPVIAAVRGPARARSSSRPGAVFDDRIRPTICVGDALEITRPRHTQIPCRLHR